MLTNKKFNPTKLLIRGRKKTFLAVPKNIRLNSTPYFVMKIPDKRELAFAFNQIAFDLSSDIEFQNFMNLYQKVYSITMFFFGY